jgi:hypothetical protein
MLINTSLISKEILVNSESCFNRSISKYFLLNINFSFNCINLLSENLGIIIFITISAVSITLRSHESLSRTRRQHITLNMVSTRRESIRLASA